MKTLSNNDIWILRTFVKLNDYIHTNHENVFEDFGKLHNHIRTMTYRNRATSLRDVYEDLRQITITYFKGESDFLKMLKSKKFKSEIERLMIEYKNEIIEVTKEVAA